MTTIRKSIFETNSSSTHSVSIFPLETDVPVNELVDHIILGVGEYGWGVDHFHDTFTKLDYLAVEIEDEDDDTWKFLMNVVKKYYPNITFTLAEKRTKGYIDHQSYGIVWDEIGYDEQTLINYLFNSKSELKISNDNLWDLMDD